MPDLTLLLDAVQRGEPEAPSALLDKVYAELRQMARAKMSRESPGHTLQATALVHEAWLRMDGQSFENRAHFFSAAAEAMRRILVDRARRKLAVRHGAGAEHVNAEDIEIATPATDKEDELLAVNEALDALAAHDPHRAELVKLRYFVGLTIEEAAQVLNLSPATAKRGWTYARTWLFRKVSES